MVSTSMNTTMRNRNADNTLKRGGPYGGFDKGGSPDRKRGRRYGSQSSLRKRNTGSRSPPRKKITLNINDRLGPINQEDSVGLPVDYDTQNDSLSRIGNNTSAIMTPPRGVRFDETVSEKPQNKTLSYPYAHSGNTHVISPARTNRSSHNEFDPVQKLNSILRRLEKVLESLLT